MAPNLTNFAFLPTLRFSCYTLLSITSVSAFVLALALLIYELTLTAGYNKPIPALLTCSALTLIHSALFLSPIRPETSAKRRKFLSLQIEILSLLVFGLFTLACVARLHSSTPGLYSSCRGYFICVALQASLALGWLSFLFLCLLFFPITIGTVYHYRRARDTWIWRQPFAMFDWGVYAGRTGGAVDKAGGGGILGH
ncbi:hypothetical protein JCM1840_003734 [Sporobolomyces johnsonii]